MTLILPQITANLPHVSFNKDSNDTHANIHLTDFQFNISSPIDMIMGSATFWNIIEDGC